MRRAPAAVALAALALLPSALEACTSAGPTTPASTAAAPATGGTSAPRQLGAGEQVTVTYCNGQRARITEPPILRAPAPAAVYVHGGSWVSGNLVTGGFIIRSVGPDLASLGFVVVSIDYRLGPDEPWPAQIEDVKCAIRYLRANAHGLNINPDAIGAWGHSAGGHLVALLGMAGPDAGWDVGAYAGVSSKIESVVDMAGPSDLLTLGNAGAASLVRRNFVSLLGGVAPDQLDAALRAASPVTYVTPGDPPFLLLHSDNDRIVPPEQSKELAWYLTVAHVPVQLVVVHRGGHNFDQPGQTPDAREISGMIVDFFIRTLILHQPPGGSS
jgi:acetyl esterase/lipase